MTNMRECRYINQKGLYIGFNNKYTINKIYYYTLSLETYSIYSNEKENDMKYYWESFSTNYFNILIDTKQQRKEKLIKLNKYETM